MILINPGVIVKEVIPAPAGGYHIVNTSLYPTLGLYLAFLTIIGLYTVIMATKTTSNIIFKKGIFMGFTLAVIPCLIIYFILYPVLFNINLLCIGPLFTLAFPYSVTYALIQPEGLMNVRIREILGEFLVKSITYILLILASVIIFVSVLSFIKWMWIPAFESNLLLYLPGVGLAAFVSTHFKPTVYIFVYKLIYGHRRLVWREKLLALSLNLKRDCTDEEVIKLIKEQLPEIINTDTYHLLFYNQESETFKIIDSNKVEAKDKQLPLSTEDILIQRINISNELKVISEIETEATFENGISIFQRYNIELCLPIKQEKNLLGIICLGKRNLFPEYDPEQKKELNRLIYLEALPYIQSYLKSIARKLPYIISIHIHDIPDEILKTKSSDLLEYLLNPDKVRIKIIKDGNRVLTKELNLTRPEKIIFNYIVFRAYINDVYHKYPNWQRIPSSERVFSEELANREGIVMKALSNYHKYLPGGSRIRQWVSSIRKILTEIGANDLIPCENPSNRGRGRGYTINGKIILLKENLGLTDVIRV